MASEAAWASDVNTVLGYSIDHGHPHVLWASSWPVASVPKGGNSGYLPLMVHPDPVSAYTVEF